ncbi:hypothetical protein [Sporosarcina sp. FSL K6-3457]
MNDTLQLLAKFKNQGLDYVHVSVGSMMQNPLRDKDNTKPAIQIIQEQKR